MNIKQKLTSRKFWAALVSFVTSLLVAFNVKDLTVEQVTIIVSGIGSLVCYIFSEGAVDKKAISKDDEKTTETDVSDE